MINNPNNYGYGEPRPPFNFRFLLSLGLRIVVGGLLCYYIWLVLQIPTQDEVAQARKIAMTELSRFSNTEEINPQDFDWVYSRVNGTWTFSSVKDHHVYYMGIGSGHIVAQRRDAAFQITIDSSGAAHVTEKIPGKNHSPDNYTGEGRDDGQP